MLHLNYSWSIRDGKAVLREEGRALREYDRASLRAAIAVLEKCYRQRLELMESELEKFQFGLSILEGQGEDDGMRPL